MFALPLSRAMVAIRVIHATDFIETTVEDTLDLERSRRVLYELAYANAEGRYDLLIDLRRADGSPLSYPDVFRLVNVLAERPEAFGGKVALLDEFDNEGFAKVQFFEASASVRGFRVRTFIDYEVAMRWLLSDATEIEPETPDPAA
jgi:hypothetical protein